MQELNQMYTIAVLTDICHFILLEPNHQVRQSTYGRHQWKTLFYIFDADALLFYTDAQAFVKHERPVKEVQFTDNHFVTFVSGKQYKHSGFIFSFKLMNQTSFTGAKKALKLGSRSNEDLRDLVMAVKSALCGRLFARANAGMVEEAEFIKSVCAMDQSTVQHDADEENDSDGGNSD